MTLLLGSIRRTPHTLFKFWQQQHVRTTANVTKWKIRLVQHVLRKNPATPKMRVLLHRPFNFQHDCIWTYPRIQKQNKRQKQLNPSGSRNPEARKYSKMPGKKEATTRRSARRISWPQNLPWLSSSPEDSMPSRQDQWDTGNSSDLYASSNSLRAALWLGLDEHTSSSSSNELPIHQSMMQVDYLYETK